MAATFFSRWQGSLPGPHWWPWAAGILIRDKRGSETVSKVSWPLRLTVNKHDFIKGFLSLCRTKYKGQQDYGKRFTALCHIYNDTWTSRAMKYLKGNTKQEILKQKAVCPNHAEYVANIQVPESQVSDVLYLQGCFSCWYTHVNHQMCSLRMLL